MWGDAQVDLCLLESWTMENVYENVRRELTPQLVKEALQLMLERLHVPENEARINAAKEQAGDDMVEVMRTVFPIVLAVQMEVVAKFGFVSSTDGLKEFLIRVNSLSANEHADIYELLVKIREVYLRGFNQKNSSPASSPPTTTASAAANDAGSGKIIINPAGATD